MKKYIFTVHALVLLFILTVFLLPTRFTFLTWNIFLALVPFDLALMIRGIAPKSKLLALPLTLIWLIFYPNTIYMITDFAHLSAIGTDLVTSVQILNYSLLATGIFLGVSMGISSARLVLQSWFPENSQTKKLFVFTLLSALSAYAIYIGRYLRLNSWDLFVDLHSVLAQMHASVSMHTVHFVLIFTFLQIFLMLIFVVFTPVTTKNDQVPH